MWSAPGWCFADGTPDIVAYPIDREAYGRLCKLLSRGNLRGGEREGQLPIARLFDDLRAEFAEGQLFILHARREPAGSVERSGAAASSPSWRPAASGSPPTAAYQGQDRARLNRLADLAASAGVPLIAVNDVLYHEPEPADAAGRGDLHPRAPDHRRRPGAGSQQNAERHLKPPREMARLFREHPEAHRRNAAPRSPASASRSTSCATTIPTETIGNGETAQETLERLTWAGAREALSRRAFPTSVKAGASGTELCLIAYKDYAPYFLTVHDIVRYARDERNILCQGRGSAANSAVCFCLGVTEVDPDQRQPGVRPLPLHRARRAARHRRRFRARAARGGDAVCLQQVRRQPHRADRHRHLLPLQERDARDGQGVRPFRRHDRRASTSCTGAGAARPT